MCNFKRIFLKCCVPWLRQKRLFQPNMSVKFTETDDSYQRKCHFWATFFRNVAYRGFAWNLWVT